jgi:surface antigen
MRHPPPARSATVTRPRVTFWLLLIALQVPLSYGASGMTGVLKNSPFASFTDSDYTQFFASVRKAAEGPVGGDSYDWANAETGAQGKVRSTRAFHREEGDCRELRGENSARGRVQPFRVTVCKKADGSWVLAPTEPERKPAPAPAADPTGFPVKLPASYSGVLPCADCPGMKYALEFHEDGTYRLRTTYLEKGPDHKGLDVDDHGAWQLVSYGARVTLHNEQNKTSTYIIKDANTLRLVDEKGDEFKSKLNYDLKHDPTYAPIDAGKP